MKVGRVVRELGAEKRTEGGGRGRDRIVILEEPGEGEIRVRRRKAR